MHRLWTIPEIVSVICASLSQRDCAQLVRVHSMIWSSVIHLVWAKVPGISCLCGLLPDLHFDNYEVLGGQVFLSEQQWARFDIHSKLIKELKVEVQGRNVETFAILQKAWTQRPSASSRSLIPTIKHLMVVLPDLCWRLTSPDDWATLFSDTLLSFNYTFRCVRGQDQVDANLVPCLEALRTTSPHLQTLTLQVEGLHPPTEVATQAVVETIGALDKLDSLGLDFTPYLPAQIVDDVLSTGRFRRVYLGDVVAEVHPVESPTVLVTPHSVTDVGLSGGPGAMASFLNYIDPLNVRRVAAKDPNLESFGADGMGLWEALSRFPTLDQLELNLSIRSFRTLLLLQDQLQRLISFSIGPGYSSTDWISYRTLPQLAALLPRIEELRIVGYSDGPERDNVFLETLQCFATSCPHLRKLRIPISLESSAVTGAPSHPSIQEIDFRGSMISRDLDPKAAAKTIAAMFPKLLSFSYVGEDDVDMDSDDSNMYHWEDLAEVLGRLLPGLIVSVSDDDERAIGSFGDFFSDPLRLL